MLVGAEEVAILGENARHVGMALEDVLLDQREELVHLATIVDILGKDILVQRIPGRPMHEEIGAIAMVPRVLEIPNSLSTGDFSRISTS